MTDSSKNDARQTRVILLEYQIALEKAVLEHAKSIGARPVQAESRRAQIPGWMDNHVWAMAMQLNEKGQIVALDLGDSKGVGISNIQEAGNVRLKEILAEEERVAEASRLKAAATNGSNGQQKWWKRLVGRSNGAVQH